MGGRKFPATLFDRYYAALCRPVAQLVSLSAKLMALNRAEALLIVS